MADFHIDAKQRPLGRLASEISLILQGKRSARYSPRLAGDDRVLLENYREFSVTGRKREQKTYYRHTGYMGHLKSRTLGEIHERDPKRVLREAVRKMLPKNKLQAQRLKKLIFMES
ncbi:MAG: 50S ribosomal protein L13 [Candidatus Liptonbacteria bacterium]|nr:50S ribosomal protein L13 [Candidatus Liptonbacteria bacterium]